MSSTFVLPRGVVASSMTPFRADGSPDLAAIGPHIDWLIAEGVAGLSPIGTAGEFYAMESADRKTVLEAVMKANAGRKPIIAGTHHFSTAITIDLGKHAASVGADAMLIVPPYYACPNTLAVMDHYRRIAEAVPIPTVLYHNSAMTNSDLSTAQLKTLWEEGAIAGVKFSNALPDKLVDLFQATGGKLPIYAGFDFVAFEAMAHGLYGWISGIPSVVPSRADRLYRTLAVDGDLASARQQWTALAPLMRFMFQARNNGVSGAHSIGVMKAALAMIGPGVGDPKPPIPKLSAADRQTLAALLVGLGYDVQLLDAA